MWEHMSEFLALLAVIISVLTFLLNYQDKKKQTKATLLNTEARTKETETDSMLKRMTWLEKQVELLTGENITLRERLQIAEITIEDLQAELKKFKCPEVEYGATND